MIRVAGRATCRSCRREASASLLGKSWRAFSAGSEGGESRLVELSTKDQYIDFPRDKSVLYFTAKWCPPCRRIGPFFSELSSETPGVEFGKIDIDDNPDATKMANILSVPTFKFFKGGEEIDSVSGADAAVVERKVAKLAES